MITTGGTGRCSSPSGGGTGTARRRERSPARGQAAARCTVGGRQTATAVDATSAHTGSARGSSSGCVAWRTKECRARIPAGGGRGGM